MAAKIKSSGTKAKTRNEGAEGFSISKSISELDKYVDAYYYVLIQSYELMLIDTAQFSSISSKGQVIQLEIRQFSNLFDFTETQHDWSYLLSRLQMKNVSEIKALHDVAIEMQTGKYLSYIIDVKIVKQIRSAEILAIKKYLSFLKEQNSIQSEGFYIQLMPKYDNAEYKAKLYNALMEGSSPLIREPVEKIFNSLFENSDVKGDQKLFWNESKRLLVFFILLLTEKRYEIAKRNREDLFNESFLSARFEFKHGKGDSKTGFTVLKSNINKYLLGRAKNHSDKNLPPKEKMCFVANIISKVFDVNIDLPN